MLRPAQLASANKIQATKPIIRILPECLIKNLNGITAVKVKDQQIEVLKEMLRESNDRERGYLKALDVTLEDMEKEND